MDGMDVLVFLAVGTLIVVAMCWAGRSERGRQARLATPPATLACGPVHRFITPPPLVSIGQGDGERRLEAADAAAGESLLEK
jgi:hypothetical protein